MALDQASARLSRILVDQAGMTVPEAEAKLNAMCLRIGVRSLEPTPAFHAALLTAILVGAKCFRGGVHLDIDGDQPLAVPWSSECQTLREAIASLKVNTGPKSTCATVLFGHPRSTTSDPMFFATWDEWSAGYARSPVPTSPEQSTNPLAGIAAATLAVGAAFRQALGFEASDSIVHTLWPTAAPNFSDIYLPGSLWVLGLGNLGQAFIWALSMLPFQDPSKVLLFLQDDDRASMQNLATSVLTDRDDIGNLKGKLCEAWVENRNFSARRVDRRIQATDRLLQTDPRVAFCGFDKIGSRKLLVETGFDAIVDAGLGRSASDFDRYRVTVFDKARRIDDHFIGMNDEPAQGHGPLPDAYRDLEKAVGACGMAEYAGASVAAPYVSVLAATTAITRLIALSSGLEHPVNTVGWASTGERVRYGPSSRTLSRGIGHSGHPRPFNR